MTSTAAALEGKAREIAAALGTDWTAEPVTEGHRAAYLTGPDSARILLLTDIMRPSRLLIVGDIPTPYSRRRYDYVAAEITVSRDKGAAKIAADITRRLLPAYLPKLSASLEDEAAHTAYASNVAGVAARLEAAAPSVLRADQQGTTETRASWRLNIPTGYGNVTAYADSVSIEANGITPDQAARILEILASA